MYRQSTPSLSAIRAVKPSYTPGHAMNFSGSANMLLSFSTAVCSLSLPLLALTEPILEVPTLSVPKWRISTSRDTLLAVFLDVGPGSYEQVLPTASMLNSRTKEEMVRQTCFNPRTIQARIEEEKSRIDRRQCKPSIKRTQPSHTHAHAYIYIHPT